jgi:hypothetical protein
MGASPHKARSLASAAVKLDVIEANDDQHVVSVSFHLQAEVEHLRVASSEQHSLP